MKKFLLGLMVVLMAVTAFAQAGYQLPDPHFEDWSGDVFDGAPQMKYWHASNVSQSALGMSFDFNFAHRETGRSVPQVLRRPARVISHWVPHGSIWRV